MSSYSFYRDDTKLLRKRSLSSYFIVGIIGAVIGGMLLLTFAPAVLLEKLIYRGNSGERSREEEKQTAVPETAEELSKADIAKKVMPSVVGIKVVKLNDKMVFEKKDIIKTGSGVIADKEGYILTNSNIVSDSSSTIMVYLADGRAVQGSIVWSNKDMDIVILKINADSLVPAEIGNSEGVEVGDTVMVFGNPSGLRYGRTAVSGIISSLNRSITVNSDKMMEDLITTDAPINEENNGGPIVDSNGRVIGISTLAAGESIGTGFAIPINILSPVVKSFVKTGGFRVPYTGIKGMDRELAGSYDYKLEKGIYVAEIDTESPAYASGIRKDDIILEINNTEINTLTSMKQALFTAGVGSTVEIKYQDRFGTINTTAVNLIEKRSI